MVSKFKIIFTDRAQAQYDHCLDYISNDLRNPLATTKLFLDFERTLDILRTNATSFALCEDQILRERNLRKIHLKKYKYKLFYRIIDDTVYIDAVVNDLQDIEKALS